MNPHAGDSLQSSFIYSLALTGLIFVAEIVGGIWTGSLALLSDAAHVFLDVFALGISFIALRISSRPPDSRHTFGFHRFEVLAALVNGVSLVLIAIGIFYEAIQRLRDPDPVKSTPMLIIALIGLAVNLVVALILKSGHTHPDENHQADLNVHSAYLHVLGDAISSVGVIVAAILIAFTGWLWVDPAVSMLIGVIILSGAYRISRKSIHILLEGTPDHLDIKAIRFSILSIPNIVEIHDLHIWNICSGHVALSAHLVTDVENVPDREEVLLRISNLLLTKYNIEHSTIQLESDRCGSPACGEISERYSIARPG